MLQQRQVLVAAVTLADQPSSMKATKNSSVGRKQPIRLLYSGNPRRHVGRSIRLVRAQAVVYSHAHARSSKRLQSRHVRRFRMLSVKPRRAF